jgi:transposase
VSDSVWKVRDELWETIEPLLPGHDPGPRGGRPRADDRACFAAIMYVMLTGIAWRHLPRELGVSPATRLHAEMLRRLNAKGAIDWKTGVVDGSHVRALRGGSRWALAS